MNKKNKIPKCPACKERGIEEVDDRDNHRLICYICTNKDCGVWFYE